MFSDVDGGVVVVANGKGVTYEVAAMDDGVIAYCLWKISIPEMGGNVVGGKGDQAFSL